MIRLMEAINGLFIRLQSPIALLGRLLLAFIFVDSGIAKIPNYPNEIKFMRTYDVSPKLLPLVILLEVFGGLAIAVGFLSRLAGLALAFFSILAAIIFFPDLSNEDQWVSFTSNLAIAGGLLMVTAFGPGRWSVDSWLSRRKD